METWDAFHRAFVIYSRAVGTDCQENAKERLQALSAGRINWTVDDVIAGIREETTLKDEHPEVIRWFEAFLARHRQMLLYMSGKGPNN